MRVFILDDNAGARRSIFFQLNGLDGITEIVEEETFSGAIKTLNNTEFDLAFLPDKIENQEIFHLLDGLTDRNFDLVIVAKSSDLAYESIKYNPKAFIIKPTSKAEIEEVVSDIISSKINAEQNVFFDFSKIQKETLITKIARGYCIVELSEVEKITSFGAYSKFHLTDNSTQVVNGSLSSYEESLKGKGFERIHSSTIINVKYIRSFIKEKNEGKIIMKSGDQLKVSRSKKDNLDKLNFLG